MPRCVERTPTDANGHATEIRVIDLKSLLDLVASIEQGLRAFGRRNRSLREFLAMAYKPKPDDSAKPDPRDGLLPLFLVEHEGKEERFYSEKERQDYFAAHNLHVDIEGESESRSDLTAPLKSDTVPVGTQASAIEARRVREIELHEVKMLNKHLVRLRDEFDLARGPAAAGSNRRRSTSAVYP